MDGQMMYVTFTTVTEYLYLLKGIAKIFSSLGTNAMFYLAAAVSDFYLPAPEMVGQFILTASEWDCMWHYSNSRFLGIMALAFQSIKVVAQIVCFILPHSLNIKYSLLRTSPLQ